MLSAGVGGGGEVVGGGGVGGLGGVGEGVVAWVWEGRWRSC